MDKFVSIKPLDSQLQSGQSVLKADDYKHLVSYEELLRKLAAREKERELRATEALAKAIQSGVQQGREQAHHQLVEQLLEFTVRMNESLRNVELALTEVVIESVRQIIAEFDNEELVKSTVRRGMELVRGSKKLVVRVNPQMREVVAEQLQDWEKQASHLEVLADHQLKLDECVIESEVGIINTSVELQVQSLIKALRKAFPAPAQPPRST